MGLANPYDGEGGLKPAPDDRHATTARRQVALCFWVSPSLFRPCSDLLQPLRLYRETNSKASVRCAAGCSAFRRASLMRTPGFHVALRMLLAFDFHASGQAHVARRPGGRRARMRGVFRQDKDVLSKNPGRHSDHRLAVSGKGAFLWLLSFSPFKKKVTRPRSGRKLCFRSTLVY
jgi:hypothetical protein